MITHVFYAFVQYGAAHSLNHGGGYGIPVQKHGISVQCFRRDLEFVEVLRSFKNHYEGNDASLKSRVSYKSLGLKFRQDEAGRIRACFSSD